MTPGVLDPSPAGAAAVWVAAGLAALAILVALGGRSDDPEVRALDRRYDGPDDDRHDGSGDAWDDERHGGAQRGRDTVAADRDGSGRTRGRPGDRGAGPGSTGRGGPTEAEVSSALALLALAYRSGLPTWDVLEAVADGLTGRAATELRQVATALRWGASESEAWASVGSAWAPAARALVIAQQAGVPPSAMLLAAADDLREAELERLEVSAAKVGVRLVAPLGLVLLPAFCLTTVAPLVIALADGLLRP